MNLDAAFPKRPEILEYLNSFKIKDKITFFKPRNS